MNRNTELHFRNTPKIDIRRSKFEESHSHKTTFNTGDIIPVFVDSDILPGDTVQMDMAELIRMATPIYPIMDNLYADIYWFFVPHRLVWEHWAEFWGENDNPWIQETEYEIPQITSPSDGWTEGTIADYMGIPTKVGNLSVNALPFRAYAKIWNDWFRDQNLKQSCHIYKDETTRAGSNANSDYVTQTELGGAPCKAAKMHDYFTSALPAPQKGPQVTIPLGTDAPITGTANVTANLTARQLEVYAGTTSHNHTNNGLRYYLPNDTGLPSADSFMKPSLATSQGYFTLRPWTPTNAIAGSGISQDIGVKNLYADDTARSIQSTVQLNNALVDLSNATAASINQLRTAFAIQKYYENAGLHGTRYIEYIRSVFGVTSSDARMQRAEYLGGERVPLNIDQILQTSSTDATSPQGNTAGFSCTINKDSMFTKSFEEHGTLMCLCVVRTEHTYQQGVKKMWTRRKWTDFYNPFFANLGEMPINNEQIYAQGTAKDKEVFGYQEAWAEYRYKENYVSGYMRSNATGSLDVWHFADNYSQLPTLGTTWINETYENVDRTIAVTSQLTHQFIADFYFKCFYTRPMPVYSVPGLIDHV